MGLGKTIWATPAEYLRKMDADTPVLFFAPAVLQGTVHRFVRGFPGLVTYAVKSNPEEQVIENISAAGVRAFDVASIPEIRLIRRLVPGAVLHYNNPVRARREIEEAVALGVASYSVDSVSELEKLIAIVPPQGTEISVRFKLPVPGAVYDFGTKFGMPAEAAAPLLRRVAEAGFVPSLTFHPGTQCTDPESWAAYIRKAAWIAGAAGVRIARLNVGGGFPSHRVTADAPALEDIFDVIGAETARVFGDDAPALVCEPGRGMVGEAFSLVTQVRAVRDGNHVFLNDGIYGALADSLLLGAPSRLELRDAEGNLRRGATRPRIVFGPTCDSVDRLPGTVDLPDDIAEGDHLIFHSMGAYSTATNTRFNGFGDLGMVTVMTLTE
jgi:ornithine decarboxylase